MYKSLIQEDNIIEDEATIPVVKPYILPLLPKKERLEIKLTTKTDDINLSICDVCCVYLYRFINIFECNQSR